MTTYLLLAFAAHSVVITPVRTEHACLADAHRIEKHGRVAECMRRMPPPVIDLDSDGDSQ